MHTKHNQMHVCYWHVCRQKRLSKISRAKALHSHSSIVMCEMMLIVVSAIYMCSINSSNDQLLFIHTTFILPQIYQDFSQIFILWLYQAHVHDNIRNSCVLYSVQCTRTQIDRLWTLFWLFSKNVCMKLNASMCAQRTLLQHML